MQQHLVNFPKYSKMRQNPYQVNLSYHTKKLPQIRRSQEISVPPPVCNPKGPETTSPELPPSQYQLPYPLPRVKEFQRVHHYRLPRLKPPNIGTLHHVKIEPEQGLRKNFPPPRQSSILNKNMNLTSKGQTGMGTIQDTEDKNMQV